MSWDGHVGVSPGPCDENKESRLTCGVLNDLGQLGHTTVIEVQALLPEVDTCHLTSAVHEDKSVTNGLLFSSDFFFMSSGSPVTHAQNKCGSS